jgi:predicted transcriptional regulator
LSLLSCIPDSILIELPRELEAEIKRTADSEGLSVSAYIQRLISETKLRSSQLAEFSSAIAERIASLDAGEGVNGEDVMSRLISELA